MKAFEAGTINATTIALLLAVAAGVAAFVQLKARVDRAEEQTRTLTEHAADMGGQIREALALKLPPGTILANVNKESKPPEGWDLCGQGDDRKWEGRFLMGTGISSKVGEPEGAKKHGHGLTGSTSGANWNGPNLADNGGDRRLNHGHSISGSATPAKHTPEAIQVWFFCKGAETAGG